MKVTQTVRRVAQVAAASAALAVVPAIAGAQLSLQWQSTGCFKNVFQGSACSPTASSASYQGLSFQGSAFGPQFVASTPFTTSFGTLSIDENAGNYFVDNFRLRVSFTQPAGGQSTFTADIDVTGVLSENSATFNFGAPQTVSWAGGSFSLSLADLTIDTYGNGIGGPRSAAIMGTISNVQLVTPEPSTYALLGTGIAALGFVARRRRTNA
jgi:hypothetical protein